MRSPLRLVLDTNIWLDWLVFDNPDIAPLRAALQAQHAEIHIDDRCEEELGRVLGYRFGRFSLDRAAQTACLDRCRTLTQRFVAHCGASTQALPPCRDPADQKFLELALACGAHYLVTRDRALLALARRLPFRVVTLAALAANLIEQESAG